MVTTTGDIVTAYGAEHRSFHAGQLGAFGLGAVWLLTLLLFSTNAVPLHHFALAFDHSIRASQKHEAYTTPQLPGNMTLLTDLAVGFWAASMTVLLVFQHRAAKVARLLGFPAKISPGLGVGAWFIPVAWYWLPYQSLAGCLPPEHPHRGELLRCWLLLCVGITLGTAGLFTVPYAKYAGWLVCGLAALAWIGYLTMAPRPGRRHRHRTPRGHWSFRPGPKWREPPHLNLGQKSQIIGFEDMFHTQFAYK